MRRPVAIYILLILTVAFAAADVSSQLQPGDLVATATGVVAISRSTGRLTTLVAGSSTKQFAGVQIGPGNRSLVALRANNIFGPPSALVQIDPKRGTETTIASFSTNNLNAWQFVQDQDGTYVLGIGNGLYRASGTSLTPIVTGLYGVVVSLAVDRDVGHYVGTLHKLPNQKRIFVVDRLNHAVSTFVYGYPTNSLPSIEAHDQTTGAMWASYSWHVILLDGFRILKTVLTPGISGRLAVDQPTSDIFVPLGDRIVRYTQSGTALLTVGPYPGMGPFGSVAVWGSRKLSGTGTCRPGSTYQVTLDFPLSANAPYCAALSMAGMRPGIKFGNGTAHIVPDPLFFATVCGRLPGLTTGFVGTLDASGRARASFQIAPYLRRGTVLTFSATAWNPGLPSSADLSGVLTVVVQ